MLYKKKTKKKETKKNKGEKNMKKRLTRKLFLSLAAMGVTAATLTTSTFAWYTANSEAKVTQIQASTESKGSDSLFVAAAQTYTSTVAQSFGGYLAEVDPVTTNATGTETTQHTKKLRPVYSYVSSGTRTYKKLTGATGADKDTPTYAESEDDYDFLEFVIRVRSGNKIENANGAPLYFSSFNLTSTASDATQIALASGGNTGITAAGEYGADIIKALKLDISSATAVTNTAAAEAPAVYGESATGVTTRNNSSVTATTYGFEGLVSGAGTNIGTANALGYYNTVMGTNLTVPSTGYSAGTELTKAAEATSTNALVVATLPKTETGMDFSIVEIRFVLYLDGWDNYCYDVMQNQSVSFSFSLTTDASKSVMQTPATSNNSGNQGD